jgi:hypothetical protein
MSNDDKMNSFGEKIKCRPIPGKESKDEAKDVGVKSCTS